MVARNHQWQGKSDEQVEDSKFFKRIVAALNIDFSQSYRVSKDIKRRAKVAVYFGTLKWLCLKVPGLEKYADVKELREKFLTRDKLSPELKKVQSQIIKLLDKL